MSDPKHLPWNEGLPTKPDVDLLMRTWPEPQIGDRYDYAAVGELIGADPASTRFRTVTTAWRSRMIERGFVIECIASTAFYVATADQISAGTHGTLTAIVRKSRKQRRKLSVAKIETDTQRGTIEHQSRLLNVVEREAKKGRMNLLPTPAVADRPQITPPSAA